MSFMFQQLKQTLERKLTILFLMCRNRVCVGGGLFTISEKSDPSKVVSLSAGMRLWKDAPSKPTAIITKEATL